MAPDYGLNGNVGHTIMEKDEQYRHYVKVIFGTDNTRNCYLIHLLNDNHYDQKSKRYVWLILMGLIETWDII